MRPLRLSVLSLLFFPLASCGTPSPEGDAGPQNDGGGDGGGAQSCEIQPFEAGDADGHPDPLGVGAGEARAGRVRADQLPPFPSGLQVWEGGDFVLANEHVAMVIEDVDESELYDPWGGRPVGIARVQDGALVEPGDFGEILILLGRMTVLTEHVTVMNDGSDGNAAVVRAEGPLRPLPFFDNVVGPLLTADFSTMRAAIDYELAPGARYVDVHLTVRSGPEGARAIVMHGFMHTPRMPAFGPAVGFDTSEQTLPWAGFADPRGTSFAYIAPDEELGAGLQVSGFVSFFTHWFAVHACDEATRHHARIVLGGPGVSGLTEAVLETQGQDARTITGTVRDASGNATEDVWVVAEDDAGFVSRTRSGADGSYALTVPGASAVQLTAFRRGDLPSDAVSVPGGETSADLEPARRRLRTRPGHRDGNGRALAGARAGDADAGARPRRARPGAGASPRSPAGARTSRTRPTARSPCAARPAPRASSSRAATSTSSTAASHRGRRRDGRASCSLERVVDTTGVQCGDFHIHTHRSNDSGDDAPPEGALGGRGRPGDPGPVRPRVRRLLPADHRGARSDRLALRRRLESR